MRRLIFIFTSLILGLGDCTRRNIDFFPLIPGAVRIMKVYERKVVGKDTTQSSEVKVVEVVKGLKKMPELGKVWVVEAPLDSGKSVNHFYERYDNTIFKIVPGRGGKPERIVYLIQPLKVGGTWFDSEAERELTEVVAQESVAVPAGVFRNCYKVFTQSKRVNFQQTLWLAPGLGVVKREKVQRWEKGDTNYELYRLEELVEYRVMKKTK